jgi:RNA recognition motif-containing protein
MTKKLYFGNLPYSAVDADLQQLVAPHAAVESARVATERETGRSRGFGFVEVPDADAEAVIRALNGTDFGGRALTVNEAQPRGERPPREFDRGPRGGNGDRGGYAGGGRGGGYDRSGGRGGRW